jgi:putative oxidoreductase
MKKFIRTTYNPTHIDWALLIIRICIASFMLIHGWPKLMKLCSNQEIKFADPIGVGVQLSLTLTVFAEVVCSIFIMLGLVTRLAVIPLIITMAVAAFVVHGDDPFNKMELSLHYLLVYGLLMVTGSGKYSIDHWFHLRAENRKTAS